MRVEGLGFRVLKLRIRGWGLGVWGEVYYARLKGYSLCAK